MDLSDDTLLYGNAGFQVTEIPQWHEGAERWHGLRVRFPDEIASHSKERDFYFGDDFLLRWQDYHVDVAGGFPAAQCVHDIVEVEGLRYPTKRSARARTKSETNSRPAAGLDGH